MSKIYVASSWRNVLQPAIVHMARSSGHEVYDFRNPHPGNTGFRWRDAVPEAETVNNLDKREWTGEQLRQAPQSPVARAGYLADITALKGCDICILVRPCGSSANWEMGYAMGQGKRGIVVQFSEAEPELMYSEAEIVTSANELFDALGFPK